MITEIIVKAVVVQIALFDNAMAILCSSPEFRGLYGQRKLNHCDVPQISAGNSQERSRRQKYLNPISSYSSVPRENTFRCL